MLYSNQFTGQAKVLPDPVRNVDEIPLTTSYDHDFQNNIGENSASFHVKYGIPGEWPPRCTKSQKMLHDMLTMNR